MKKTSTATQSKSRNYQRNASSPIPSREEFHRTPGPVLSEKSFYPPDHWDKPSAHKPPRLLRENTY